MDLPAGVGVAGVGHFAFSAGKPETKTGFFRKIHADGPDSHGLVHQRLHLRVVGVSGGGGAVRGRVEGGEGGAIRKAQAEERRGQAVFADAQVSLVGRAADGDGGQKIRPAVDHSRREGLGLLAGDGFFQFQGHARQEPPVRQPGVRRDANGQVSRKPERTAVEAPGVLGVHAHGAFGEAGGGHGPVGGFPNGLVADGFRRKINRVALKKFEVQGPGLRRRVLPGGFHENSPGHPGFAKFDASAAGQRAEAEGLGGGGKGEEEKEGKVFHVKNIKRPPHPVIASGGETDERSEAGSPERSNPLPVAERVLRKQVRNARFWHRLSWSPAGDCRIGGPLRSFQNLRSQ